MLRKRNYLSEVKKNKDKKSVSYSKIASAVERLIPLKKFEKTLIELGAPEAAVKGWGSFGVQYFFMPIIVANLIHYGVSIDSSTKNKMKTKLKTLLTWVNWE